MNPTSISFVMPMYNESQAIGDAIDKISRLAEELSSDYEIIIADDGSSDDSGAIADKRAEKDSHIKVVHLGKNTKFGGALKAGIGKAAKDVIVYTDSDFPIKVEDIKKALTLLEGCDIVTAYSSVKKGENIKRVIMSKVYNFLIEFLFRTNIKDINSGFKIYRRKIFEGVELISESPFIDVEIFVNAIRKGCLIKQYPVIFAHREKGKSYISRPSVVLKTISDMLGFRFRKAQAGQ